MRSAPISYSDSEETCPGGYELADDQTPPQPGYGFREVTDTPGDGP